MTFFSLAYQQNTYTVVHSLRKTVILSVAKNILSKSPKCELLLT